MDLLIKFLDFSATVDEGLACGGADVLRIIKFVFMLLDIAFIAIPIGLMVMLFIDFFKNVTAGKEDEMKKNLGIVIKRIIYCVVLFLVPTVVYFIVWLLGDLADFKYVKCIDIAKNADSAYLESVEIDYYEVENDGDSSEGKAYSCYVCKNKVYYIWSLGEPSYEPDGCGGYLRSARTEDMCSNELTKFCWKCLDTAGYALSDIKPGSMYLYDYDKLYVYEGESYGDNGHGQCAPGFFDEPSDLSECKK